MPGHGWPGLGSWQERREPVPACGRAAATPSMGNDGRRGRTVKVCKVARSIGSDIIGGARQGRSHHAGGPSSRWKRRRGGGIDRIMAAGTASTPVTAAGGRHPAPLIRPCARDVRGSPALQVRLRGREPCRCFPHASLSQSTSTRWPRNGSPSEARPRPLTTYHPRSRARPRRPCQSRATIAIYTYLSIRSVIASSYMSADEETWTRARIRLDRT